MKRRAALTAIILILAVIFAQAAFANDVPGDVSATPQIDAALLAVAEAN